MRQSSSDATGPRRVTLTRFHSCRNSQGGHVRAMSAKHAPTLFVKAASLGTNAASVATRRFRNRVVPSVAASGSKVRSSAETSSTK